MGARRHANNKRDIHSERGAGDYPQLCLRHSGDAGPGRAERWPALRAGDDPARHGDSIAKRDGEPDADGHANANPDGEPYGFAHTHGKPNANPNCKPHADGEPYGYAHTLGKPNANPDCKPNTDGEPHGYAHNHGKPNANPDCEPNTDGEPHGYAHTHGKPNCKPHADGEPYGYATTLGQPNADRHSYPNGTAHGNSLALADESSRQPGAKRIAGGAPGSLPADGRLEPGGRPDRGVAGSCSRGAGRAPGRFRDPRRGKTAPLAGAAPIATGESPRASTPLSAEKF